MDPRGFTRHPNTLGLSCEGPRGFTRHHPPPSAFLAMVLVVLPATPHHPLAFLAWVLVVYLPPPPVFGLSAWVLLVLLATPTSWNLLGTLVPFKQLH